MKKIILTIYVVTGIITAHAQFTYNYLVAADNYFKKGDYYSAAVYYEKFLGQDSNKHSMLHYDPYTAERTKTAGRGKINFKDEATFHLAESYRLLNYPAKAEGYYHQVLASNKAKYPLACYYLGTVERALAKYDEADRWFTSFLDIYKNEDGFVTAAKREILDLRFIQTELKKDISLYTVNKAPGLNSSGASYAPAWLNNNTLLFTSTRANGTTAAHKYTNHIYQASYNGDSLGQVAQTDIPQLQDEQQGVISAMPGGKVIFLTVWSVKNGKKAAAIYTSTQLNNGWGVPVALDSVTNVPGYSAQQPFVMPDGKHLLYASNRPGGLGGFDIWCAALDDNGKVISTADCGDAINTALDEQAPCYYAPANALVFATNGRVGMGGFDLFYTKGNIGRWSVPVNFGYPVNSIKDDIYFAAKGNTKNILADAMISSDRASACCLDIFSIQKQTPLKKLTGMVVYCGSNMPATGAAVSITDSVSGQVVTTKSTGNDGSYALITEDYKPLKITASLAGYQPGTLQFAAPADDENIYVLSNPAICLAKIVIPADSLPKTGSSIGDDLPETGRSFVLRNVYFDIDKSVPLASSYPSLDTLVTLLKQYPSLVIEIGGHTDSKASTEYNIKLSQARANEVVQYLASKGIAKARLTAKGYGESLPVAPNTNADGTDNPEGRQKNRRTEFKIISK